MPVTPSLVASCRHKQLQHLEGQKSALKKELVLVREALSKAVLEKEVAESEKAQGAEALAQARWGGGVCVLPGLLPLSGHPASGGGGWRQTWGLSSARGPPSMLRLQSRLLDAA